MFKLLILAGLILGAFSYGILTMDGDNTVSIHTDKVKTVVSDIASHVNVDK
jgi:hypothetical protein